MQKLISIGVVFILSVFFTYAQKKDTAFVRTYGGPGKDVCNDIISTNDNGLALVGSTSSFGNGTSSFYLIKTDANGLKKWSATYGGDNIDVATAIKQTDDKGYIIAGYTLSFGNGGYDYYLVKTDSLGKLLWQKTYGESDWEFANGLEITPDGGYLICGKTYSDTYGGSDIFLVRTNKDGDLLWSKKYGGTDDEDAKGIIITKEKNYIIVGQTASYGYGMDDGYLLKINPAGDTLFTRTYGGKQYDEFSGVDTTKSGDLLLIGSSKSYTSKGFDTYIVRIDNNGNIIWQANYGAGDSSLGLDEFGYKLKELPDGEILTVGASYSVNNNGKAGMHIMRLSKDGNWQAGPVFGDTPDDKGYALALMKNNGVAYAGYTESYGFGNEDVYLVKMKSTAIVMEYVLDVKSFKDNLSTISVKEQLPLSTQVHIAPNPFNEKATVFFDDSFSNMEFSFSVYDILGKEVVHINNMRQKTYNLTAAEFNKGMYTYRVVSKGLVKAQGKMIIY